MTDVHSTVDVRLAKDALARLTPPPGSIVNGDLNPLIVRTCCLRRVGVSRLHVYLAVDNETARRFARACRLESIWERSIPAVFTAAGAMLILWVIIGITHDWRLLLIANLISTVMATSTLLARLIISLLRSRHHPTLKGRDGVLIRDVDRETARIWAELNSNMGIEIIG